MARGEETVSIALTGAGGMGAVTAAQMLLVAAAKAGCFGLMSRSSGPQVRGGESLACLRLGATPVDNVDDVYDIFVAFDWMNIGAFSAEVPLNADSLVVYDPASGDLPDVIRDTGARCIEFPMKEMAKAIPGGRINMVGLGAAVSLIGLPVKTVTETLDTVLGRKGPAAVEAACAGVDAGFAAAASLDGGKKLLTNGSGGSGERWSITGNEAAGLGALRGGVRFVAAYPITPSSEALEWLAPNIEKLGGHLIQAEDELASINMIIGASFGGTPSMTATSGPGLALMQEGIGLGVGIEVPVVVLDVMRGGPSTGIPTKSEQTDLNIAMYGQHGDAPHLVTAPTSVADCIFTMQWSVHLAEALQSPIIVLSDQAMGQARSIIDEPPVSPFKAERVLAKDPVEGDYERYAITETLVSPMAIPGIPGGQHETNSTEHTTKGFPTNRAEDHLEQLQKREGKLTSYDYGDFWAELEGEGETAIVTWGSCTGAAREALERCKEKGISARLISLRLLAPAQVDKFTAALKGVSRILVVEQSFSEQFHKYLCAHFHYQLPKDIKVFAQPGPLPVRPAQIVEQLANWS